MKGVNYTARVMQVASGFFFLFMAYNTAQSLQTTLSENKTLALAALGVLYGALCMTTVIAPKIVQKLGPKRSMIFGSMPYVLFVFFSSNPTWATLIPASFLVGIGGGVLWNGHGVYMSRCALHQSLQSKQPVDTMTTRLNSWFYCAQMSNGAIGMIISSVVLQNSTEGANRQTVKWMFVAYSIVALVGSAILWTVKQVERVETSNSTSSDHPGTYLLQDSHESTIDVESPTALPYSSHMNIYDNDAVEAFIASSVPYEGNPTEQSPRSQSKLLAGDSDTSDPREAGVYSVDTEAEIAAAALKAENKRIIGFLDTLRLLFSARHLQMIVPLILFLGCSFGFAGGVFPLLYIEDPDKGEKRLVPKYTVGYLGSTFYFFSACFSFLWGKIVPKIGRIYAFSMAIVAMCCYYTLIMLLVTEVIQPDYNSLSAYIWVFANTICFSLGVSVMDTQIPAIFESPTFFSSEKERSSAIGVLKMFTALGYTIQFSIGAMGVRPLYQLIILLCLCFTGFSSFFFCHFKVRRVEASRKNQEEY